jgi:hypothetical protein
MNISTLNALLPASFEYTDALTGETEKIELQLKRMSFGATASASFKEAMDNGDTSAIAEVLEGLIATWNIDADGEEFAPTADNIRALPAEFVGSLAECVFKRLFPNPTKANGSGNGSEPAANSMTASTQG